MSQRDYRPDMHGLVEGTWHTHEPPAHIVAQALAAECPDCCVNVFIEETDPGEYVMKIAHDATCPAMNQHEEGSSA